MFSHSEIWMAIDSLAKKHGYSTSGLAKKAGLDPTSFNKSKRISAEGKPRWPSTESIAKILGITGSNMTDLTQMIQNLQQDISIHRNAVSAVPVIGCAQAGNDGYFDDAGYPIGEGWDEVTLPAFGSKEQRVYALEVNGDSMLPLYRDGDIIVVSPDSDLRKGDRVVARTNAGEVLAKEMIRKTHTRIELKSLNADYPDRSFSTAEINWVARVIWVSQ